jgi:hypothetical protein
LTSGTRRLTSAALAAAFLVLAPALSPQPAAAKSNAKERLAANFEVLTAGQLEGSPIVPPRDRKRTAKCLGQALAADIPDAEAEQLSAIFEGRAKNDPALEKKWLTISAKEAPARNAQVMKAVNKLCPDLGPYVKQMM